MPHRRDARSCQSLPQFVFVGERPSTRARQLRVTWQDGRLAAKPLLRPSVPVGSRQRRTSI